MPTTITKYRAKDGSEWASQDGAIKREALVDVIDCLMKPLGEKRRINEREYIQHDPSTVIKCRVAILALCAVQFPEHEVFKHKPPEEVHPFSAAGRVLDDCGGPLWTAWSRFMTIDDLGREWEQPYFVNHPPANAKVI